MKESKATLQKKAIDLFFEVVDEICACGHSKKRHQNSGDDPQSGACSKCSCVTYTRKTAVGRKIPGVVEQRRLVLSDTQLSEICDSFDINDELMVDLGEPVLELNNKGQIDYLSRLNTFLNKSSLNQQQAIGLAFIAGACMPRREQP